VVDVPAVVSSRGQITIPKAVRDALGLQTGDEVIFRVRRGRALLAKVPDLLDLGGSVPVPPEWRGASWDRIKAETWRRRTAARR